MLAFKNTENNQYSKNIRKNSHLYEPLQNMLRKSTIPQNFQSPPQRILPNNFQQTLRNMSPAQADNIKRNIQLYDNQQLIPTRNLQKIIGKSFIPVDITEKICEPISPQMLNSMRLGGVEEIVYEIKEQNGRGYNIYTSRQSIQNIPPSSQGFRNTRVSFKASSPQEPYNLYERHQVQPRPLFVSHSNKQLLQNQQITLASSHKLLQNHRSTSKLSEGSANVYNFRQSLTSSGQNSSLKPRRQRQQYKYNLFSMIDEAGNTGCHKGCCYSNEIIASKRTTLNTWK